MFTRYKREKARRAVPFEYILRETNHIFSNLLADKQEVYNVGLLVESLRTLELIDELIDIHALELLAVVTQYARLVPVFAPQVGVVAHRGQVEQRPLLRSMRGRARRDRAAGGTPRGVARSV